MFEFDYHVLRTKIAHDKVAIISVNGDSMIPCLYSGDADVEMTMAIYTHLSREKYNSSVEAMTSFCVQLKNGVQDGVQT